MKFVKECAESDMVPFEIGQTVRECPAAAQMKERSVVENIAFRLKIAVQACGVVRKTFAEHLFKSGDSRGQLVAVSGFRELNGKRDRNGFDAVADSEQVEHVAETVGHAAGEMKTGVERNSPTAEALHGSAGRN